MNSLIGNISTVNESTSRSPSLKIEKVMRCAKCLNHGELVPVKDHKNYCPWKECQCDKCSLIDERRRIMAAQVALRRKQCIEERLKAKCNNSNNNKGNTFEASDAQEINASDNHEKLDESSRKYLLKCCEQLMTELYSSLGSAVSNEDVLVSTLYAFLKEKRNAYHALASIRDAFEELHALKESLQLSSTTTNNGKHSACNKLTLDGSKDKKVTPTPSSERSSAVTAAPELAHMHLSNYYYYQRMSPYYRKLYNLPANSSVYPFPLQSSDSVLHNFLSDTTLNTAHHLIARNSDAINVSLMRQSTGQTTN